MQKFIYSSLAAMAVAQNAYFEKRLMEGNLKNCENNPPEDKLGKMVCDAQKQMLENCEANNTCDNRAFGGQIGQTISSLNEYGCWCYFGDDHGRGKGTPVDPIDEMCKVLHDGYECAMRDAEDEGATCVPWEVDYTSGVGGGSTNMAEECAALNSGNNCAARACVIEGTFVANLLDVMFSGTQIDNTKKHSNGFDQANVCATKKNGGGPTNKACCGNYPDRFPFRTVGGDRKCCGTRTFNSLTLKCCDQASSTVKFNC